METGNVTVARANAHITYPAQFQLIAAMNPCRCGYLADANRACRKAPLCGEDYQARVSGPIYDRMDLIIEVLSITARDLALPPSKERSSDVRKAVEATHRRQRQHNHGTLNGRLSGETLEERTRLGDGAKALMNEAAANFQLSARGYYRICALPAPSRIWPVLSRSNALIWRKRLLIERYPEPAKAGSHPLRPLHPRTDVLTQRSICKTIANPPHRRRQVPLLSGENREVGETDAGPPL